MHPIRSNGDRYHLNPSVSSSSVTRKPESKQTMRTKSPSERGQALVLIAVIGYTVNLSCASNTRSSITTPVKTTGPRKTRQFN